MESYRERRPLGDPRYADVRELLKADLFADGSRRCDGHFEKSRPCPNTVYGVSDQHIVLDSWSAEYPSEPDRGRYPFSLMVQGTTRGRTIGVPDMLDNVIQIESYPFCIPAPLLDDPSVLPSADVTFAETPADAGGNPVTSALTQLTQGGKVTLLFPEIRQQSFRGRKDRNFHFEYTATVADAGVDGDENLAVVLTPVNRIFTFTEPIQDMHGITMQFWNPDNPLQLPLDRVEGVTFTTDALGVLSINVPAALPGGQAVNLAQLLVGGDRVYFENVSFTTDGSVPAPAALSSYFMRPNGIYTGSTVNPTNMTTAPTLTFALFPNATFASTTTVTMLIAKNRVRAPFRVRRVVDRLTNYIAP